MSLISYIVRKIGQNKGRPRVWLEMASMSLAGFTPGKTYSREVDAASKRITLTVKPNAAYLVSKKEKGGKTLPVIDISSSELLSSFEGMEAVRVVIEEGKIHILPLASEVNRVSRLEKLRDHLEKGEITTAGVSFGGGVLDHAAHSGLAEAGISTKLAMANEIDEDLLNHASDKNDVWQDQTIALACPMQEMVQDAALMSRLKPVDVLAMGIPCSGASKAGKSKRGIAMMEDHPEVGHLAAAALMVINRIQPGVIVIENVESYSTTASAQILRQQLRDSGYDIQEKVLSAKEFGCIENRVRWFMVAATRGLSIDLEKLEPTLVPVRKLGEFLEPMALDAEDWRTFDYLKTKEVRDAAKGNGFAMQIVTPESTSCPVIRKGYHKGGSTDPLVQHPENADLLRLMTVKEHARIKGVPEHLVDDMSKTDGHILLGQGIAYEPVKALFKRIGESLIAWKEKAESITAPSLGYSLKLATG